MPDPEDIEAVIAYLRSLQPLEYKVPESQYDFPMNFIVNTIPQKPNFTKRPDTSDIIAYGKYIATAASCKDCHTPFDKGKFDEAFMLAGGRSFQMPGGVVTTMNLTPDKETGIGNRTDAEIARVLRYGVHANGDPVFDFMPFHDMSDEDLTAVISYLRTVKPVKNEVPKHYLNVMGNMVKAYLVKPVGPSGDVPVAVKPDTTAEYGKYLVFSVGNCAGCHTRRDLSGTYEAPFLSGGYPMNGLVPPNLTNDSTGRIFTWTQQQFVDRFHKGRIIEQSEMPWSSFQRMNDDELKAIYKFLKTVPAVKTQELASK